MEEGIPWWWKRSPWPDVPTWSSVPTINRTVLILSLLCNNNNMNMPENC